MLETAYDIDRVVHDIGLSGAAASAVKNALVPVGAGSLVAKRTALCEQFHQEGWYGARRQPGSNFRSFHYPRRHPRCRRFSFSHDNGEFTMHASIVTDLGFGDAGKGTIVDYLTRQSASAIIVRFNGGAQAAHNVHTTDGKHHTFSQFGSGILTAGTRTFLSHYVLFDPFALQNEAQALSDLGLVNPLSRVIVDGAALTVTPFQKAANRVRESLRGDGRHGSVGMGIGETMADMLAFPELAVYAVDLRDPALLFLKLTGSKSSSRRSLVKTGDVSFVRHSV